MPPKRSPEQRRAEVRRLHEMIGTTSDPVQRRNLAERAFMLAQEAEIIASLPDHVEGLWQSIAHYENMLAATDDQHKRQTLAQLLQDAEDKLRRISDPDAWAAAD